MQRWTPTGSSRLLGPLLLGACLATTPALAEEADNPVMALAKEGKYDQAVKVADNLLKDSGHVLENEWWAGVALNRLKRHEDARARFQGIEKHHASVPKGKMAAVEAAICLLRPLGGEAKTDEDRATCRAAAAELEGVGKKYPKDQAAASRAFYVAGNASRLAGDEDKALELWRHVHETYTEGEYPPKAMYMLAAIANREFDVEKARKLYAQCVVKHSESRTATRCSKNLGRLDVVDTPAPPLQTETWLNAEPVAMEELRGKVVLLWFFATWCPHCKANMGKIADMADRHGESLQVIGITANMKNQTTELARSFVAEPEWKIDYPVAVDLGVITSDGYGATGVPSAALVDKSGQIRWADHPTYLTDGMIARLAAE